MDDPIVCTVTYTRHTTLISTGKALIPSTSYTGHPSGDCDAPLRQAAAEAVTNADPFWTTFWHIAGPILVVLCALLILALACMVVAIVIDIVRG